MLEALLAFNTLNYWPLPTYNSAGAFIVNTGSCQLIDDCALKQLLIDEAIAGCALDGVEGPQWMEAWVWNLNL
jgi:hypothetical protein